MLGTVPVTSRVGMLGTVPVVAGPDVFAPNGSQLA